MNSQDISDRLSDLKLKWNSFGYDKFGISKRDLSRFFRLTHFFYKHYFRVEVDGIENVPEEGRGMIVGNHSGGWALDAWMTLASCFFKKDPPRLAHGMAEKFMGKAPFVSALTHKVGQITGVPENARALLEDDRLLMVFPEGARGTAKLFNQRHSLVRFGTGFLRLALENKTPIIPFAFLGGGDAIPTVANLVKIGKLLGVPYVPVTKYLFPIPKPVRLKIVYGEPMHFEGNGTEDDTTVERWVGEVQEKIASLIEIAKQ